MPGRARSTVAEGASRGRTAAMLAVVAVAFCILAGLGTWQVQRLAWKESLIAMMAERRAAPPQTLTEIEAIATGGGDVDYRPIRVAGRFDHARERHFFATYEGATGYYVYTPLTVDEGRVLFVNRGFVPFERKDAATRGEGQAEGAVTVTGLARARLSEKPSSFVPENDEAKNIFYWKDLDAMARTAGLAPDRVLPFFVDADATPNPGGLPVGGVTQFDLPNNHLQYAVTWYGLALALVAVTLAVVLRGRRERN
ncbi:SURF1 family protein [Ensifer soli]|uniref:SURF1 family protein n=1 Tax=Ciceribacter sp. sgz301302 TaxID=3342379 RepID=UPI0035B6E6D3